MNMDIYFTRTTCCWFEDSDVIMRTTARWFNSLTVDEVQWTVYSCHSWTTPCWTLHHMKSTQARWQCKTQSLNTERQPYQYGTHYLTMYLHTYRSIVDFC